MELRRVKSDAFGELWEGLRRSADTSEDLSKAHSGVASEGAVLAVRFLGDVISVHYGGVQVGGQRASLLAYLACVGPVTKSRLVEALWSGQLISKSRFGNLLAETRAAVGPVHLPYQQDNRYRVVGFDSDITRFNTLRERAVLAHKERKTELAIDLLCNALDLVGGIPYTRPQERYWDWLDGLSEKATEVELAVVGTALSIAQLDETGDRARWALERGLSAYPYDSSLTQARRQLVGPRGPRNRLEQAST